jgi:uncharacterized Tic20 family protein
MSQSDQPANQPESNDQPYGRPFSQPVPPAPQPAPPAGNRGHAAPPNYPPAPSASQPNPGYQSAPGYPSPVPPAAAPLSPADERLWGALAFLLPILVGFLGPLIIYLVYRDRSQFVRATSRESLNLQITAAIVSVGALLGLAFFGFAVALALPPLGILMIISGITLIIGYSIAVLIFEIIGAVKANSGEVYQVPFILRLVKN